MAKPTDYDKTHRRNMAAIGTRIDRIFKKAAEEAAKIGVNIKSPLSEDRIFSFDDYPETGKQIKRLLAALQDSMDVVIANGVRSGWNLANNKNDALCHRVFGDNVGKLTKEQYKRYFSTNGEALDAFLQRKTNGLNLSDRVWRYTQSFKREIELGLDLGIRTGSPAAKMARDLKQYLQHPDKLFRRVRDRHGILRLSQAAREFHPGRGVYRSSYTNARRLAITETNIAYHTADHIRWQQMDFVVGIEIRLSGNHTIENAKGQTIRLTDICDELAGKYPKDFKFVGWHPHCRCQAISILKTDKEMEEDTQRILDGKSPAKGSVNAVEGVPAAFSDWVETHSDRIAQGDSLPYFLRDNKGIVDEILGMSDNPSVAIKVKVGDKEYTLKELIAECRVEPTENGKIYVHPEHGKGELAENLEFARWRAEQFGEEVVLLPNPQHVKSADSYNITRGVVEEYKRCHQPTINAVSQEIRKGLKQAKHIIIEPNEDMSVEDMMKAVTSRISNGNYPRSQSLVELRIKIGDYEATYSRADIISKGFKIKPGDFHNVSVSRSQGSSLTSSAGSISDAKLSKFFGITKKTPQEIAAERHAMRTAADVERIQTDWNIRRLQSLRQDMMQGYLPMEMQGVLNNLSRLNADGKFKEVNVRIASLQKTAHRHAARTQSDIADIQARWSAKLTRDKNTQIMADSVLKLKNEYPLDVDFSALSKAVTDGNLDKMREEAKRVAKEIVVIRNEEKVLADLIPDVHGWHKQFSLSELQEAHSKIQATLDYWKAKGYDLATDSNLSILKKEIEQKIKFVENPGAFKVGLTAHKTWQVQQYSYIKILNKVETRIDIIKLEADYKALLGFKTTSKDFKDYMAKAKAALDAGNTADAKHYISAADWKKRDLEHRRKGKSAKLSGSINFDKLYSGGCPFTPWEIAQIKDYEDQIIQSMMDYGFVENGLNIKYHDFILRLSKKYYGKQKSIYSTAEQAAMKKAAYMYLARPSINPGFDWGKAVGGVYNGKRQKRYSYLKKLGNGITADELSIVQRFTNGSTFSNAYNLRNSSPYWAKEWGKKMARLTSVQAKEMEQIIEEWSQGANYTLDRMVRYNGITFRGLDSGGGPESRAQLTKAFNSGTAWVNEASCSTSMKYSVANGFDGDLIMVIHNKTGAYIHEISDYNSEYEIMTLRGAKYRVIKPPTYVGGRWITELEEI
ncbi:MAG: hypothetical protein ACI4AK_05860 [Lepagella sp.]